jgi:plastocyanin
MRYANLITISLLAVTLAACGGSSGLSTQPPPPPPPPPPPVTTPPANTNEVAITNDAFTPTNISVPVNTTVTWTWNTCGSDAYGYATCESHNVLFDDGATSGAQNSGTFARTFATAGTFNYHCSIHGAAVMSGTVVVQ